MKRQPWFELHDQPWFPRFLRDLVTEALEALWNTHSTYRPAAPRLREALRRSGARQVVDLCSGGGGPWPSLYAEVADGGTLQVYLTDRYPNARMGRRGEIPGITAREEPVDAQRVPAELRGFRTIFSSFHHFDPPQARAILEDAFRRREGIAILEASRRSAGTILAVTGVPLLAIRNALRARPWGAARIFWTCVLPVIPAVLWMDGVLSCLRSYSRQDMAELTAGLAAPDYEWATGEERAGVVPVTWLIGTPLRRASESQLELYEQAVTMVEAQRA